LKYLQAEDYPQAARAAIREMHRQVDDLRLDERGLALRGILVRHLVMPEGAAGTPDVMRFLAEEISPHTYVNIMAQYRPSWKVTEDKFPEINRRITHREYGEALAYAKAEGLYRGFPEG